jgi:hypothetical protein
LIGDFGSVPFPCSDPKNHEITNIGNKSQLIIIRRNIYISCRKQHIIMCTWSTNKSKTHNKI